MERQTKEQTAYRVSVLSILSNLVLSAFKLFAGILASSSAMISDAIHSASDVFSTLIVMAGVKMAAKEPDREHPYGHERMECVAAVILAAVLCVTGLGIGYAGFQKILSSSQQPVPVPGALALVAAATSIAVKEAMYWYTRFYAKKIRSGALMADAWHHRSDALSSVGSLIGIAGARLGLPIFDPIASILICFFIVKAAVDIFRDAIGKMTDQSCDEGLVEEISQLIQSQTGVRGIDKIRTRLFGDKVYVDVEISADGQDTLRKVHAVAECVHHAIEQEFPLVKHCMVHVNPASESPEDSV